MSQLHRDLAECERRLELAKQLEARKAHELGQATLDVVTALELRQLARDALAKKALTAAK